MKIHLALLLAALVSGALLAQEAQPALTVTKVQFQTLSDMTDPSAFSAHPKIVYRLGDRYGRLEEEVDPEAHAQRLIVVNEPDTWVIDMVSKTGQHAVQRNSTFKLPILPPDRLDLPKRLTFLQYGQERAFFERCQSQESVGDLEGDNYRVLDMTEGTYRLRLYCHPDTRLPYHLDVDHNGKRAFYVRYLSYQTDLPFDPAIFQPPAKLKLVSP